MFPRGLEGWWFRLRPRWPSVCLVCGCWPAAPVCAACLAAFAPEPGRWHAVPAPLAACVAAVDYAYPWDRLIARFKFQQQPGLADTLAALWSRSVAALALADACDWIVPVPLSRSRLAERGYNQAWELIRAFVRRRPALAAKAWPRALQRRDGRADQHRLTRRERLHNLRGAFEAGAAARPALRGRHVLLVDDVLTTGSTLASAAEALHHAGAARVSALVVAATPPPTAV
jgi:ComF family protein